MVVGFFIHEKFSSSSYVRDENGVIIQRVFFQFEAVS